ncbi:MAG: AI-2E family transporter [Flavobacteriales bacterium]|nr:MAG: AI-2E family transporter [Flavobacteriales bacterium]
MTVPPTPTPGASSVRRVIQPQYQKFSLIILGLIGLFYALHHARPIMVPMMCALLLAMLLNPVVNRLTKWRVPRILAITLAVLTSMALLAALAYFIVTQAAHLNEAMPRMKEQLNGIYREVELWAQQKLNLQRRELNDAVEQMKENGMAGGSGIVGETITTVGALFAFFFLLPVYTFLLLLYKKLLTNFLLRLFGTHEHDTVKDVLGQTKVVVQSYLSGLLIEAFIVASLNWIGLTIIGVKYALLLAVVGALLNLVPYIGMMIATVLPMAIALATQNAEAALWVLGLYLTVQFIDNNFIVPRIVGSRVELNALVSLLAVMIGAALWGIPGMFLALPVTAILKVVFDHVPAMHPFGYVMGDDEHREYMEQLQVKNWRKLFVHQSTTSTTEGN